MVLVWNVCACECVFVCVCVCLCEDVWQPSAGGELGAEGSSDLISATGCTPEKSPKVTAIITPHTHTHTTHTPHTHHTRLCMKSDLTLKDCWEGSERARERQIESVCVCLYVYVCMCTCVRSEEHTSALQSHLN